MLTNELVMELNRLTKSEKLRVVQLLVNDLAVDEIEGFGPEMHYEVWSPQASPETVATLLKMLDES
jgi:hypothetical protein